ncbi:MAG TPA: NUDIX domain-containing protein [Thermomicrobiales bacterium]|nr:NUDIX domain-containing protein [Thermomicrobiales bacterium]
MGGVRESGFGNWEAESSQGGEGHASGDTSRIPNPESRPTTDPQDELFDVLDDEGRPTGVAKRRGDVHRDGDWHGALHIWVCGVGDDGRSFTLFQRRSMTKDTWPGYLDTTIGGHIRSGETLAETVREAEEEIGLAVSLDDLTWIGRRSVGGSRGQIIDREVQSIYAVRSDQPLPDYRLHPQEVDALVAVELDAVRRLFAAETESVPARECPRGGQPFEITITRDDFAIRDRTYVLAVLPGLAVVIAGRTPEPFDMRGQLPNPM